MQITATEVSYIYNKKSKFATKALNNISIQIQEGDFFGIIGHTGSGKSTFVQHLNALLLATSGKLTVGEFDLSLKPKKIDYLGLRRHVGLVFQYPEYQLFADSVVNDVGFALKNFCKDMPKEEQEKRIQEAIEIVGLDYEQIKNTSPFELSGGQKRRVAIAGVLVSKPEVLILDEPAAGLDPCGKQAIMQLLHTLHSSWCKTVVIISHDMDEIVENCNRVAAFHGGEILLQGTPKEVFQQADVLLSCGLDIPTTAKLLKKLQEHAISIDCDFTIADFTEKLRQKIQSQPVKNEVKDVE